MSEEIRPALSAEEWGQAANPLYVAIALSRHAHTGERLDALAALALQHAGPDGGPMFTRKHLTALVWARGALEKAVSLADGDAAHAIAGLPDIANDAIDRLASLLPPRP